MNQVVRNIIGIARMLEQMAKGEKVTTPRGNRSKHQLSKRGATHKANPTFRSRRTTGLTPAQYRHQHFANPRKAEYEALKVSKRKWISA